MYCKQCGAQTDENAKYCPMCGAGQTDEPRRYAQQTPYPSDTSNGVGYGFLGFFFPIVGLILFLVWRWERPKAAKAAGLGALISTVIGAVAVLIVIYLYFCLFLLLGLSLAMF